MSNCCFHGRLCLLLLFISIFSFLSLTSQSVKADNTFSTKAVVNIQSSCSMSAVLEEPHTATIPAGTNKDEIGLTTFTVSCNDGSGYSVFAVGYSNNQDGNNKLIATLNGGFSPIHDIRAGTGALGSNSSWGMMLTPGTNLTSSNIMNNYSNYNAIPSSMTEVVNMVPSVSLINPTSFDLTYRVNISDTTPAGNYDGKVKFTMIHPADHNPNNGPQVTDSGYVGYYPNSTFLIDTMVDQAVPVSSTTQDLTLWSPNFKRTGYGFVGWSDAYDYVANVGSQSNPDAQIYGPNDSISISPGQYSGDNPGLSLYAVWVKTAGNLQNWNGCSAMSVGEVTALTDLRDGDTYAVAKLADEKCWMIENLRLDYDADFTESLSQGFAKSSTYGNFIGLAKPEIDNFTANSTYLNSIYYNSSAQSGKAIVDIGSYRAGYRFPRYRNDSTNSDTSVNPNTTVANMTSADQNVYSYGNYYTWAAANASTINYSSQSSSEGAGTSICPAGWKIPTTGNFSTLDYRLGGTSGYQKSLRWRRYPNNIVYSGGIDFQDINFRGIIGNYWSASSSSETASFYLEIRSTTLSSSNTMPKARGYSVRCVAL